MALIVSICFFVFFIFIWHSTALNFLIKEKELNGIFPLSEVFFPKPKEGKFVSYLALFVALVFGFISWSWRSDGLQINTNSIKIVIVFCIFPLTTYFNYLARRLCLVWNVDEKRNILSFKARPHEAKDWILPIAISAGINFIYQIL